MRRFQFLTLPFLVTDAYQYHVHWNSVVKSHRDYTGQEAELARKEIEYDLTHLPFYSDVLQALYSQREDLKHPLRSRSRWQDQKVRSSILTLRRNLPRKPFLWLHLHKAGGSLMCGLAELAGERIVKPSENCNWKAHDGYFDSGHPTHGVTCMWRLTYFRLMGFTYGQIERELWPDDLCMAEFDYGVLLREPLSLMRSMMNYHPDKGKQFVTEVQDKMRTRVLPECNCQDEVWKYMDNFQTRVLARALDVPVGQINRTHVRRARALLDKFAIVGRLEDLPTGGAAEIFATLQWNPQLLDRLSTKWNPAYSSEFNFTEKEEAWLKDLNKHDIALWEHYGKKNSFQTEQDAAGAEDGPMEQEESASQDSPAAPAKRSLLDSMLCWLRVFDCT